MKEGNKPLPKWILIVSGLFAVIEIGVSISLFVSPESVLDTVDHSAKGVDFLFYMWAVRQFALGFIFAYATFMKSRPMLMISYIFLLVMFIGDCMIGVLMNETPLIISALVMCMVAGGMVYAVKEPGK